MDPSKFRPSSSRNPPFWTTNQGHPVFNNKNSLTAGARGPVLLEDYHLIEKLAQFDRERIPERVVHARGAAAKGYFEVTRDVSHLSCADFLRAPGVQTPCIVRFSTVIHPRGSPEALRDPRGFAIKLYTREGNYDIVGNNMPVFFIRDAMQFPDVVHAFKPNPVTNQQENWRIFDFLSHVPESCHMLTFLFHDAGIPYNYRHMKGFGVNTYKWINKAGEEVLIKYHFVPTCGERFLLDDEAVIVGGKNQSHATKDLYDHIAGGGTAEWTAYVQCIKLSDQDKFDFDPLDVTKVWPEDQVPMVQFGRLVLNRNPDNFFAENEQLAFCPGVIVPGVGVSNDKLLQGRIFSYSDTQRHRLGPNYLQIPVNTPRAAVHDNHHEGMMNTIHRTEEVNYFPSRNDPVRESDPFPASTEAVHGNKVKQTIPKENNFKQAGDRYRSWSLEEQTRFIQRIADGLNDPRCTDEVRSIWLRNWSQCDAELGAKMAKKVQVRAHKM